MPEAEKGETLKPPETTGLYWARVGQDWFIVNWQDELSFSRQDYASMAAIVFEGSRIGLTTLHPRVIAEWGKEIVPPL